MYRNETGSQPYMLTLAECSNKCTLDKFIEITKQWIPDDYAEECQVASFQKWFTYNKAIVTSEYAVKIRRFKKKSYFFSLLLLLHLLQIQLLNDILILCLLFFCFFPR